MGKLINDRYQLQFELPNANIDEAWLAKDTRSGTDEVLVQLYLVRTTKASDLTHNIVMRRATELSTLNHCCYLHLSDFGFDPNNVAYFFVYPQPGNPGIPAGTVLERYITQAKPTLSWSCELLLGIARFLSELHSRDIAHGGLNSGCIILTNPLQREFLVTQTGLADMIDMLKGRTGASDQSHFEVAAARDIEYIGLIAADLLCRKNNPPLSEVRQVIQTMPDSVRQEFEQMVGLNPEIRFAMISEVKRTLESVLRKLQGEQTYYLCLTTTAINQLHEFGLIPQPRDYIAAAFLNEEFKRGVFGWSEASRDGDGLIYRLSTAQMRLWCVPDNRTVPSRHLVIKGIGFREPADLALDWEYGMKILARLQVEHSAKVPPQSIVIPLIQAIESHSEKFQQTKEADIEDKSHFKLWEDLLTEQQRLLREFQLPYYEWEEVDNGAAVEIRLTEPPGECSIDLGEDDLICMTSDDGRQKPAGYFEDLTGNVLKLGLARNVDLSGLKSTGILTLDNSQIEAVLYRQQRAMKRLRFRETVNPNLLDFLSEPAQLSIDNPMDVKMWFQQNLDDSQMKAVRRALATRDMFLVQGPPGTGKTSVIAELVVQIIERQDQAHILVTSQSNVAVNNALGKIVELRPELSEYVVRVGREEKAGSTEGLLLDRQLQNWRERVLQRSDQYLANWENKASGEKRLTEALGILDECQEMEIRLQQRTQEIQETEGKLAELNSEYEQLERALNRATQLKQQAESVLSTASQQDERLRKTIRSFQNEYLDWASAFLEQANRVAGISFMRTEAQETLRLLGAELQRLEREIEAGISSVNEFMQTEFNRSFTTLQDMRRFIDQHYAQQREEMAILGRVRRLVDEWKQQVGKDYRDFSSAYLSRCKVVGATCLGVAAKGDISELEFDWVIVDEAGKATHPELLVPIVRGRKIVLVGDHRQLPPTIGRDLDEAIKSEGLQKEALETSLFQELMQAAGGAVKLPLTKQYRMHPAIGTLIGKSFYPDVGLENGVDAADRQHGLPWCSRTVMWYSTKRLPKHEEAVSGHSRLNQAEVDGVIALLDRIEAAYTSSKVYDKTIGVITGYLAQKAALRQRIAARKDRWLHIQDIEVNTVDAYQGRERDIIIYSVVRSNPKAKIGFLRDERRLNVALSRARELLIIIGDEDIEFADVRGGNPFHVVINHIRKNSAQCALEDL